MNFFIKEEFYIVIMVIQKNTSGSGLFYRSLLILFGGLLMALAALAGQMGYKDDYQIKSNISVESRSPTRMMQIDKN